MEQRDPDDVQFERMPPSNVEAEMCLIASMMLDKDCIGEVVQIFERDAFFQGDHQVFYDVLVEMYEKNVAIDAVLLKGELEKRKLLSELGGVNYIGKLLNSVPSAAHAVYYAELVMESYLLRRVIRASNDGLRKAYAPHTSAIEVVESLEKAVFDISQKRNGNEVVHIEPVAHEVFEAMESKTQRGIETGYFELDDMLNGMQNGEMLIVAARPSIGKTAFAMNVIENVAIDNKIPCAVFSLEMSKQMLVKRMMCSRGRIDAQRMRRSALNADEYATLADVVASLARSPIWIDDSSGLTIMNLRGKARRLKLQHDIKFMVVDYLQLMEGNGESRQQIISDISRGIKAISRDLNIPVMALSQLNRNTESREGHRPRMSDLRESGSQEQDSDVVMLLHREDYYRQNEPDFIPDNIAEVILAKQRNGPTGTVKLVFNKASTRFENLASATTGPF